MNEIKLNNKAEPSPIYRWMVLVFISMAMFGNYYIYDSISPLADLLKKQLLFSDANIGLLNAIYSIPNIFMVVLGGFIIDRIGTKKSTILFSALCMIGAIVTSLKGNLTVMVLGRLIFGLGAESTIVAITTVIAKWFKGKELSFAFGLNLTLARMGSFLALNSPTIAKPLFDSWQKPLYISIIAGIVSVIAVIVYFIMESEASQKYTLGESEEVDKVSLGNFFTYHGRLSRIPFIIRTIIIGSIAYLIYYLVKIFISIMGSNLIIISFIISVITITITTLILVLVFQIIRRFHDLEYPGFYSLYLLVPIVNFYFTFLLLFKNGSQNVNTFGEIESNIFDMKPSFWFITFLCVTFYSAIFPFQTFAVKFFMEQHDISREMAGFSSSFITFASMVGTPLFGLLIDKVGKRASLMMLGSILLMPVYLLLAYTNLHPLFSMWLMGIAFSLVPAAMWPSVALIVEQNRLGTAYGLMTMIQNIGLAGFNLIIGHANDISGGYTLGMWIFSSLGFAGLIFAFLLKKADLKFNNNKLEMHTA